MTPSALILSILGQAKEPLLCLNGAGYFSEEEWIQLDLIINKKYVWTTGPNSRFHNAMKAGYNANKLARTNSRDSSIPVSEQEGVGLSRSSDGSSYGTSVAPSLDGVGTSTGSADFGWELALSMKSPAPAKTTLREKTKSLKGPQTNEFTVEYTPDPVERVRTLNSTQTKSKNQPILPSAAQRGISACASAARNGLPQDMRPQLFPIPSETLVVLDDNHIEDSVFVSKRIAENGQCKDINAFETNNAAEWDEEPVSRGKSLYGNDMKVVFEEEAEKIENIAFRENQALKAVVHGSLPQTPLISPPLEGRSMQRTATVTRSIRRRNARVSLEPRYPIHIPSLPKTKTCWFWAETVGGCRYRPEECLNLHVKPKPGTLPNYPLKDGKPTWGCLADATPQAVPEGKKPRSCWFWATKGACQNVTACKYVHGWVAGGVAARPKNLVVDSSDVEDNDDSEEEEEDDDDHVDLSGRDVGDKAPSQAINITPGFIASRVYAIGRSPKTIVT